MSSHPPRPYAAATRALAVFALFALASCGDDLPCPAGSTAVGERCIAIDGGALDGGLPDASVDAQTDLGVDEGTPDAGPCGMVCPTATPLCDVTSGSCVECTATNDDACTSATPVCDTTSNTCVACNVSSDCSSLAAPQCNVTTHVCEACTADAACMGRPGTTVCDTAAGGDCVQCTADNRMACGANVCAPATNTCTTLPSRALQACEACLHDAQCQTGQLCVATVYADPPPERTVGSFCLWRRSAPLPGPTGTCGLGSRPYAATRTATSTDGVSDSICDLRTTTCPALLQQATPVTGCAVPFTDDAACGAPMFNDGRCRLNGAAEPRCSYPCGGIEDCRSGFSCPSVGDQFCSI